MGSVADTMLEKMKQSAVDIWVREAYLYAEQAETGQEVGTDADEQQADCEADCREQQNRLQELHELFLVSIVYFVGHVHGTLENDERQEEVREQEGERRLQ